MKSFSKHIIILFFISLLLSCNSNEDISLKTNSTTELNEQNKNNQTDSIKTSGNEQIEFVYEPCVYFFSMSDDEYDKFLLTTNVNVKWQFDIMFKRFKREAKSTRSSLKKSHIKSFYTTKPLITFVSKQNDTILFKRKDEDYFMGQIFFSGADTIIIEEGLMKLKQLEEKVINFFQLSEDFKIKPVYEKVDASVSIKKDTIKAVLTDTIE